MFKETVANQAFKKLFNATAEEETVTGTTIERFLVVRQQVLRLRKLAVYRKPSFTLTLHLHHLVMGGGVENMFTKALETPSVPFQSSSEKPSHRLSCRLGIYI